MLKEVQSKKIMLDKLHLLYSDDVCVNRIYMEEQYMRYTQL